MAHQGKLSFFVFFTILRFVRSMEKNYPKWGREALFPTNPDLVDVLGDMHFDFEICVFEFLDSKFPDGQVPRFSLVGQWALFTRFGTSTCQRSMTLAYLKFALLTRHSCDVTNHHVIVMHRH